MSRDAVRQTVVVVTAVTQAIVGLFGDRVGEVSDQFTSPTTPAGYAFAIWGVIYLAALVFAVYQALPSHRGDQVLARAGWPAAAAFTANALWVPTFQMEWFWAAQGLITLALIGGVWALLALARAGRSGLSRWHRWLARLPLALLAGWVTVAFSAGLTITLVSAELLEDGYGFGAVVWALLALLVTGAFAVGVTLALRGSFAYPAAVAWGTFAIMVEHLGENVLVGLVAGVVTVAVLAAGGLDLRDRYGTSRPAKGRAGT